MAPELCCLSSTDAARGATVPYGRPCRLGPAWARLPGRSQDSQALVLFGYIGEIGNVQQAPDRVDIS